MRESQAEEAEFSEAKDRKGTTIKLQQNSVGTWGVAEGSNDMDNVYTLPARDQVANDPFICRDIVVSYFKRTYTF
jgi:hypothetical protein